MYSVGKIHPAHFSQTSMKRLAIIDIYTQRQPMATSSFGTKRGELEVVSRPLQPTGLSTNLSTKSLFALSHTLGSL